MDLNISDRRALVTGGSQGIGLGIATALAAEGTEIIIASRNSENIERAIVSIRQAYPEAKLAGCAVDLSDEQNIRQKIGGLLSEKPIDILINNVGGPPAGPMTTLPLSAWDTGYQGLLRSVLVLTELVLPSMKKRAWGRLLTITSTAAKERIPNLPISATFRAGLSAWTKNLAKEVGRSGILVNNILPGPIQTGRLDELEKKSPEFYRSMQEETAIGRIGKPDEVGRVAAFLCSAANTFVTGTDVFVDGGYTRSY
ncbi:MAG: SDR family oxidoreductase [Bdellovibrionaceae bacterium]|nr:SDR family oxidoreductase [Pseudobdellovibrionaceae bacterium]